MKMLVSQFIANVRTSAAALGVAALCLASPATFAQETANYPPASSPGNMAKRTQLAPGSGELRAAVFPSGNPLKMKVCFENPALQRVVLTIRNNDGAVVHSSLLTNGRSYVGLIDLTALPDGDYTIYLTSRSARYVQPLQLQTETARLALLQQ